MGSKYLKQTLEQKISNGEKLFIPYIVAGDGGLDQLEARIHLLTAAGASAIELGIPFSDPVADGPVIQAAGSRALQNGTTLKGVLKTLQAFQEEPTIPIVIMTYLNPIYHYGIEAFARDSADAGIDGVIIPDLPMEEEHILTDAFKQAGIANIRLAAPNSTPDRLQAICQRAEGFLYAVSVMGTTGVAEDHAVEVKQYLQQLKQVSPVPVLAGFGVANPTQAKTLSDCCDGVIVGSKIVELFHQGEEAAITSLIQQSLYSNKTPAHDLS